MKYEEAKEKLKKTANIFLGISGVHGIGIGLTPNSQTKDYSIFVDVHSEDACSAVNEYISQFDDRSDIICTIEPEPIAEVGMVGEDKENGLNKADINQDSGRYRPVVGGVSISTKENSYGTFSVFVKSKDESDDRLYLLSNRHVLKEVGKMVCQPSYHADNRVGTVIALADYDLQDAAIAEYTKDISDAALNYVQDYGKINGFRRITQEDLGSFVVKRGARTGYTRGIIDKIDYICQYTYGEIWDCIKILPVDDSDTNDGIFVQKGDSGSPLILEEEGNLIGLVFAGPKDDSGKFGIACRITYVFSALNITLP